MSAPSRLIRTYSLKGVSQRDRFRLAANPKWNRPKELFWHFHGKRYAAEYLRLPALGPRGCQVCCLDWIKPAAYGLIHVRTTSHGVDWAYTGWSATSQSC